MKLISVRRVTLAVVALCAASLSLGWSNERGISLSIGSAQATVAGVSGGHSHHHSRHHHHHPQHHLPKSAR